MGRSPLKTVALAALGATTLCLSDHASAADSVRGRVLAADAPARRRIGHRHLGAERERLG